MSKVTKAFAIKNAKISFVSLVDKAANLTEFLITKSKDNDGLLQMVCKARLITKATDVEKHYVTGIVYEPMVEDAHGNYMTADEIAKAESWYQENGNNADIQHSFEPAEGVKVVKSWIAKDGEVVGDTAVTKGAWLMTMEVTSDKIWKSIENGELTGFSMGGVGEYSRTNDDISKSYDNDKKSIFKKFAEAFGFSVVEKGDLKNRFNEESKHTLFWNAWYSLQNILCRYNPMIGKDELNLDFSKVMEAIEDFKDIYSQVIATDNTIVKAESQLMKAGKKLSSANRDKLQSIYENVGKLLEATAEKEDDDMSPEAIEKMLDEKLDAKLDELKKALAPNSQGEPVVKEKETEPLTKEAISKMLDEAIEKALDPDKGEPETITKDSVSQMIEEKLSKALHGATNLNGEPEEIEKSEGQHYMTGMF